MKIASFNINNINRRLPNLLDWLSDSEPDVVCLQELKAADEDFPAKALHEAGYEAVWRGQKSWNGVAILSRSTPIVTCTELPGDATDTQSRYLEAAVNGVLVASIYAPNGNPRPGPKFGYKLGWMERLAARAGRALCHRRPRRIGRRLQRRADRPRYLQDEVLGSRRAPATRKSRRLSTAPFARVDGRRSRTAPRRAVVHLLGLQI